MLSGIKYNLAVIALLCMACSAAWGQKQSAGTPYGWHTPGLRKAVTIPYLKLPVDTTRKTVDKRLRRCYAGNVGVLNADVVKQGLHITTDSLDIWKLGIYSKDAESISLIFSSFDIDQKSGVYLYTPDKSLLHGKYGADNVRKGKSLPVSPIAGDSVIVEYQVPKGDKTGLLVIGDAAHNFKSTAGFNTSNNCSPHSNTQEALSEIERATCHLYICDRSSSWFCTGSMINSELHKPYIYTAGHCYSGNYYNADVLAERTVVTFNYEVPARDTLIQGSEECSIAGTTLRIYNESLDCTLLEMDSMPPKDYRPYLAGWNRNTPQEGVYTCIQHPNGDSKRVSYTSRPTIASCSSSFVSDGFWKVEEWDTGTTEEGSSGSGLLDPQLRIIGALTGGQSYCDSPYKDYYSRFDIAWDYARGSTGQLKYWLSPESELTQMDGFDAMFASVSATCPTT